VTDSALTFDPFDGVQGKREGALLIQPAPEPKDNSQEELLAAQ